MKLRPLKYRELISKLRKLGWTGPYSGLKHPHFVLGNRRIRFPNDHGKEVTKRVVRDIVDQIGITVEEFFKL